MGFVLFYQNKGNHRTEKHLIILSAMLDIVTQHSKNKEFKKRKTKADGKYY